MANKSYYNDNFNRDINRSKKNVPEISTSLDSVRAYSFEVHFHNIPGNPEKTKKFLTLAAKKVESAGQSVEDIAVRRLNDLVYYPGAASQDELKITFDDLIQDPAGEALFNWFRTSAYDPLSGRSFGSKASRVEVVSLNTLREVKAITTYYGVYVKAFKPGEFNYTTNNEFHVHEVTLRYDFMDHDEISGGGFLQRAGRAINRLATAINQTT